MDFENITPFIRFAANQNLISSKNNLVGYDHRFYFCIEGSGEVVVNNTAYPLTVGAMLIWKAGTAYSYRSKSKDFTCITCNFDYTSIGHQHKIPVAPQPSEIFQEQDLLEPPITFNNEGCPFNETVYIQNAMYLLPSVKELVNEYEKKFTYYRLRCNIILSNLLLTVMQHMEISTNHQYRNLVNEIINYIREHFHEELSNKIIGDYFGYHPTYINSLFKKYTNSSLHQYIIMAKLHNAVNLLLNTDKSIDEIAQEVNISDDHYFSRLFKSRFGMTPSDFRNNRSSYNNPIQSL